MTQNQHIVQEPLLLTVPQVAKALALSRAMVYLLIQRGDLRAIHIGRAVRISISELRQWVQKYEEGANAEVISNQNGQRRKRPSFAHPEL